MPVTTFAFAGRYGPEAFLDGSLSLLPGRQVRVDLAGTTTLAVLYTDRTKATAAANPATIDSRGNFTFFADPGEYDMKLITAGTAGAAVRVAVPIDPQEAAVDPDINVLLAPVTVVGSRGGNAALASLLTALAAKGLITDGTTA